MWMLNRTIHKQVSRISAQIFARSFFLSSFERVLRRCCSIRNGECDSLPLSISDSQVHIANTTRSAMVWISEGRSDIEGGLKAFRTVQVSDLSPDSWLIFRPLLCLCYEFFFVELVLAGCGLLRMAPVRTWFLFRLSLSWSASPSFSALSLYFFVMSSDMSLLDAVGTGWLWS